MNTIKTIFRSLFKKGQGNVIKILSLAIGLSVGLVLISKVYYEQSFDSFYPDKERIYQLTLNFEMGEAEPRAIVRTSGAIAPYSKLNIAGVEDASRVLELGISKLSTDGTRQIWAGVALADSNFFDMLPRKMLIGNANEILTRPMHAIVSRSIQEKLGGDAVGKTFELAYYPGRVITIAGVFEDVPLNSHMINDILISMESIAQFTGDGRENWFGNERYASYVKLAKGQSPSEIGGAISAMVTERIAERKEGMSNLKIWYTLVALPDIYSSDNEVSRSTLLLSLLAIVLIGVSIMNYVLIVSSTIISRVKEVAIRKCFGADKSNISEQMYVETAIHLLISLIIAGILIFVFRSTIEEVLSSNIYTLFRGEMIILLALICICIVIIAGVVPAILASRISVTNAISRSIQSKRVWRLGLLFVQFAAVAYLVTLLAIVGQQYKMMVNDKPGYEYENLVFCNLRGIPHESRQVFLDQMKHISSVESAAACYDLPYSILSGNNVRLEGINSDMFNVADYYDVTETFIPTMGLKILDGDNFKDGVSVKGDVLVSQSFIDQMHTLGHWKDGSPIGKVFSLSEHEECTIRGVLQDFRQGTIANQDNRPKVMFYTNMVPTVIVAKLHQLTGETVREIQELATKTYPEAKIHVYIYQDEMILKYRNALQFRNTVSIGGLITLLIAIIGLIGYTRSEVNRRQKEIAIRKISGSTLSEVVKLFVKDILWLSIPAIVIGEILSVVTGNKWMESFSEKASLSPLLLASCAGITLVIILAVVCIHSARIANTNPVEILRKD